MKSNVLFLFCIIVLFLVFFEVPAAGAYDTIETARILNATPVLIVTEMDIGTTITKVTDWDNKTSIDTSTAIKENNSLTIPENGNEKQLISDDVKFPTEVTKSAAGPSHASIQAKPIINANTTMNHSVSKGGLIYRSKNGIREVFDRSGRKIFPAEDFKNKSVVIPIKDTKTISKEKQYGSNFSERALNGQFDQVTETYEQEIWNEQHDIWWPPIPEGWSFTQENGPEMFWEPDDWGNGQSDFHASVIFCHTGDRGAIQTTIDATGGQYVSVKTGLGYYDPEPLEVYLDDILLGNITAPDSTIQFDISDRPWSTASTLKIVAAGDQWTNQIVRSISLKGYDTIELPLAGFNGTPLSGDVPLDVVFTDEAKGNPITWFWSFGDGGTTTLQNPTHTYSNAGNYTVSLTVTNAYGNNTMTKDGYVVVTAPISNQATDIAGRTITQPDIDNAASQQQSMNYQAKTIYNAIPSDIKPRLPNDQIFFFFGHGTRGKIQLNDTLAGSEENLFYGTNDVNSFDDASVSYTNTKLAVLLACRAGATDATYGNIVDIIASKGGSCAIGWTENILDNGGPNQWSATFWNMIQDGDSIVDAYDKGIGAAQSHPYCQNVYQTWPDVWDTACNLTKKHYAENDGGCSQPLPSALANQMVSINNAKTTTETKFRETAVSSERKKQIGNSLSTFAKKPVNNVKYLDMTHQPYADLYQVKAGDSSFWVNANNGRVQSMTVVKNGSKTTTRTIDLDQGSKIAESYANEKYPELWKVSEGKGIKQIVKKINNFGPDQTYEYSWQEIFYTSRLNSSKITGIPGSNLVALTVSPYTGKVIRYHEWYVPYDSTLNITPSLTEGDAMRYAESYFHSVGLKNIKPHQISSSGLGVAIDENNHQHLTWSFNVNQKDTYGFDKSGFVGIDAHNGGIVWHASIT